MSLPKMPSQEELAQMVLELGNRLPAALDMERMHARTLWAFYKEALSQGFSEQQAFSLTLAKAARG